MTAGADGPEENTEHGNPSRHRAPTAHFLTHDEARDSGYSLTMTVAPISGLVPMHIGLAEPGSPAAAVRFHVPRLASLPLQQRSALTGDAIDWHALGAQPRWLGQESFDCAVALEPGVTSNQALFSCSYGQVVSNTL